MNAQITGIAHYVPPTIYDNQWFIDRLDTTDEWIRSRTGITERHIAGPDMATTDMALPAAQEVLRQRGMKPEDIECIIFCTVTPDRMFPPSAAILQRKLGASRAWGFDLEAACSSFLYGLVTAAKLVESGAVKNVLLVGADKMSSIVDYTDRSTCVLFGDAASIVLLEPTDDPTMGIIDHVLRMDGNGEPYLHMKSGGSMSPPTAETVARKEHYLYQEGQTVFKSAVKGMADVSYDIMQRNNLTADDVSWLVPHQANLRIIDATAERMGLTKEKVMINIDKYGNTTSATIPMCMSELYRDQKIKPGDLLVLAAFGAGYTFGSVLLRWSLPHKEAGK
jgi:3-oxoacyl-[acyl-carrier-protein] synthase-3